MLLQRILALKQWIVRLFWVGMVGLLTFYAFSGFRADWVGHWDTWGRWAGQASVYLFALSLLPGILRRFAAGGVLASVRIGLLAFRRQLGIGMFLMAFMHVGWMKVLPAMHFEIGLLPTSLQQWIGFVAYGLTLPLFLTANDWAVKTLGQPRWHLLHRLVYLIVWLVAFHVALVAGQLFLTIFIFGLAIVETLSLLLEWVRADKEV